jgi:DNA-binding MarR family transcriptional regulator
VKANRGSVIVRTGKKAEDRDQQVLSRLAHIEHKVESIDETNAFALRADSEKHMQTIKAIFKNGRRRAQVYLAADGTRGVVEIAQHLDMKTPNVSPQLRFLKEEGLLQLIDAPGRQNFWAKKSIDKTLRISRYLCETYGLRPDGKAARGSKKRLK